MTSKTRGPSRPAAWNSSRTTTTRLPERFARPCARSSAPSKKRCAFVSRASCSASSTCSYFTLTVGCIPAAIALACSKLRSTREVLQNGVGQTLAQPADVGGTEAVDIRGVGAAPAQPAEPLDDDRRLPDAPRTGDEDMLAILEPLGEPTEVHLATDEVGRRHRPSD